MQSETESEVGVMEIFERKDNHQYFVKVYQNFSYVGFQKWSVRYVQQYKDQKLIDSISVRME